MKKHTGKREPFDGIFSIVVCFILLVLCTLQFAFRSFFNASLAWTEESAKFFYVSLVFFATSFAIHENAVTRVEFLEMWLKDRKKAWAIAEILVYSFSAIFSLGIAFYGIKVVQSAYRVGESSPALLLPMWAVYSMIPIAFVVMGIRYFQQAWAHLHYLKGES